MLKRHQESLRNRLDSAKINGHGFVTWAEIYKWFNAERISSGTWKEIKEYWELLDEEEPPTKLLCVAGAGGVHFIPASSTVLLDDVIATSWDRAPKVLDRAE